MNKIRKLIGGQELFAVGSYSIKYRLCLQNLLMFFENLLDTSMGTSRRTAGAGQSVATFLRRSG